MDVLFDRVAGIDVGKATLTVCVRTPGTGRKRNSETRTFRTMTRSLVVMAGYARMLSRPPARHSRVSTSCELRE